MGKKEVMKEFSRVLEDARKSWESGSTGHISIDVFKRAVCMLAELHIGEANELVELYKGRMEYDNFLTEREAMDIVSKFENEDGSTGAKWRPEELFGALESLELRQEEHPYFNKWALYVAMNMEVSDRDSVIRKWSNASDQYVCATYDLALTDLKDKDRPMWIREYFHVDKYN